MGDEQANSRLYNTDGAAEDLLDDVLVGGDFIDDFQSLQGIMSAALGTLGFKFSFVMLLLFNFVYTVYNAFFRDSKAELSVMTLENCSCDPIDEMVYSISLYIFIGFWVLFQLICAMVAISQLCRCSGHNTDSNETNTDMFHEIPGNDSEFLKRGLKRLAAMNFCLNLQSLRSEKISLEVEIDSAVKYMVNYMEHEFLKDHRRSNVKFKFDDNICNSFKYMLAVIQFLLRLPTVPLLLIQWLDEYSWNCVIRSVWNYCNETQMSYAFYQSMIICCLYIFILLSIFIDIIIKSMPVNSSGHPKIPLNCATCKQQSQRKHTLRSKWCLLFEVDRTVFFTNVSFILIIALVYTAILSQLTYVAITETERDVNSGRTFNIGGFNRPINGGVSNSVLWKCSKESNSHYLQKLISSLLILLIATTIFYVVLRLTMVFFNYQKFKKLIKYYYVAEMHGNDSLTMISTIFHKFFQLKQFKVSQNKIENHLAIRWEDTNASTSTNCCYLFLIPIFELILIPVLFLLVLTSYNVYPIGCFLYMHDVDYDEMTNKVLLELTEGVCTYQQVAVVAALFVFLVLIVIKCFHIRHILASDMDEVPPDLLIDSAEVPPNC